MLTLVLIINIAFLMLTIIFSIKLRSDFENLKNKNDKKGADDELKIRLLGLEERINSLEEELKKLETKNIDQKQAKSIELNQKNDIINTPRVSEKNGELDKKANIPKLTQSLIINLFNQGKKEEEIANLLGLSFEEVKLILMVSQKGK